ncbi:MAG TPA: GNAT family N-acetyltransferase [Gaiellaceae bacterium]|jgi:GNAT superfamily N-acetyltransferase|nr:GNAT family N-acetyltransferase [Gaiellaceae bacterium]
MTSPITIRRAESDADLERWRQVRMAVVPRERAGTLAEIRNGATSERLLLLAELDGELAGSGVANRSDLAGQGSLAPRVLPRARRQGVGTALLRELAAHVEALGFDQAGALVEDPASLPFAERFGFREVDRDVEQVRTIGDERWPEITPDVEVVSLAERPELFARVYYELAREAFQDFALDRALEVTLEDWEREWRVWPEGTYVALAGDEIVGFAGLHRDDDRPDRAENSLTAVRRDRRRRGIASLLKRMAIAWASANGVREIYTWNQRGNEAMRAVNESLGYVTRSTCIRVRGRLPLPL